MRGFFLEGLIYGAYICVSKSIGLALLLEVNLPVFLCFTLNLRAIFQVQAPGGRGGAYIWRGFCMEGLIFGILRYAKGAVAKVNSLLLPNNRERHN